MDGDAEPERLAPSAQPQTVMAWSSEGVIAYAQGGDIWVLPTGGEPAPFFTSEASEWYANFSPDGHWLAYASNQTGRDEVWVRPYPGPGPSTQISGNGGHSPSWSADGRRISFIQPGAPVYSMLVVDVIPGEPFRAGRAAPMIDPWPYYWGAQVTSHDVLSDGSVVTVGASDAETLGISSQPRYAVAEIHVVLNWFTELRERMGSN